MERVCRKSGKYNKFASLLQKKKKETGLQEKQILRGKTGKPVSFVSADQVDSRNYHLCIAEGAKKSLSDGSS